MNAEQYLNRKATGYVLEANRLTPDAVVFVGMVLTLLMAALFGLANSVDLTLVNTCFGMALIIGCLAIANRFKYDKLMQKYDSIMLVLNKEHQEIA